MGIRYSILILASTAFLLGAGCSPKGRVPTTCPFTNLDGLDANAVTELSGRLFANAEYSQHDSQYVDLSGYKNLILHSMLPANRSSIVKTLCSRVAELSYVTKSTKVVIEVLHYGNGHLLFSFPADPCVYERTVPIYPVSRDKYLDESGVLCGLIHAIDNGDDKNRQRCVDALTVSTGYK
jgi:hypothetical protein